MTMRQTPDHRLVRRAGAAALVALLMTLAAVVGAPPSGAEEEPTPWAVGLTWRMSTHAFTSTSLAPAHATTAPATKDADVGFVFPEASSVTYDIATGAGEVTYPGAFELGNTNQGNYRIRLADPVLTLDGDGTGSLSALVSYALTPAPETPHSYTTPTRVVVANLTLPAGAPALVGTNVHFTVTPDFEPVPADVNGYRQFPQTFIDALHASLRSHFRQSGSGSDPNKPPAPLTVSFDVDANEVFVQRAYQAVLGRGADSAGLTHWLSRLEAGASRHAVANALALTAEGQRRTVNLAFQLVLGRDADPSGRGYWVGRLQAGLPAENLLANLLISDEAIDRRAGNDPEQWVELLFTIYLGRAGDPGGVTYWTDRAAAAQSAAEVRTIALGFGRTGEATAHGTRTAIAGACGSSVTPTAEQRTTVTESWTSSGHHPLRTAGTALAHICPTGAPTPA